MGWSALAGLGVGRGAGLWVLLLLSVMVRETVRAIAAAWVGLPVKQVLLLPTGGLQTYEEGATVSARARKIVALTGPAASAVFGLTMAGMMLTVAPGVDLVSMDWISPGHLVRSLVWLNLLLAGLNLLPVWPLDGVGYLAEPVAAKVTANEGGGAVGAMGADGLRVGAGKAASAAPVGMMAGVRGNVGQAMALVLVVLGMARGNSWLLMGGVGVFLWSRIRRDGVGAMQVAGKSVKVRDVMLTEYSILSASATLEDALEQSRHTLQDVFPVVRAGNMVGAVGRAEVLAALERTGNGYVQGIMAKEFATAGPEDGVSETLGRVNAGAAAAAGGDVGFSAQLVPVLEGERIVGILTPGNLQRSIGMTTRMTRVAERRAAAKAEDERD